MDICWWKRGQGDNESRGKIHCARKQRLGGQCHISLLYREQYQGADQSQVNKAETG